MDFFSYKKHIWVILLSLKERKTVELKSFTLFILFLSVIDFRLSSNTSETRADEVTITWSFLRKTLDQDKETDMGWLLGFSEVIYNHEFRPDVIKSAINDYSEHSKWTIIRFFFTLSLCCTLLFALFNCLEENNSPHTLLFVDILNLCCVSFNILIML